MSEFRGFNRDQYVTNRLRAIYRREQLRQMRDALKSFGAGLNDAAERIVSAVRVGFKPQEEHPEFERGGTLPELPVNYLEGWFPRPDVITRLAERWKPDKPFRPPIKPTGQGFRQFLSGGPALVIPDGVEPINRPIRGRYRIRLANKTDEPQVTHFARCPGCNGQAPTPGKTCSAECAAFMVSTYTDRDTVEHLLNSIIEKLDAATDSERPHTSRLIQARAAHDYAKVALDCYQKQKVESE